ncbi:small-conductance mechanosensitive channel, partial [Fischerella thermalis CCMEE 5319]
MYPEEYQNPQPTDESLQSPEEKSPTSTNEQTENLSVEPVLELTTQNSTVDTEQNNLTSVLPIANSEASNSQDEFVVQQQEEITILGLEHQPEVQATQQRLAELQKQEQALKAEIADLQAAYKTLQAQMNQTQIAMGNFVQETLSSLEQRKNALQISVEQLERRQERIRNEMRTTFAGASQELAIRVQGFKDYLTGSLQDLAAAAEQLQLVSAPKPEPEKVVTQEFRPAETQPGT